MSADTVAKRSKVEPLTPPDVNNGMIVAPMLPVATAGRAFVLAAAVVAIAFGCWGHSLLNRPLWMDEVHSWLLISDPDPAHALQALASGADYNPPVYYAIARLWHLIVPKNAYSLRLLSLLFLTCTMAGTIVLAARRTSIVSALAASLLVCSHELILLQSTEVRFYSLWLALLTWFVVCLTPPEDRTSVSQPAVSQPAVSQSTVSLSSILCSTGLACLIAGTHYFGIISVGLCCFSFTVWHMCQSANSGIGRWKYLFIRCGLPMAASSVMVVLCLPMLRGQKAALSIPTWVATPDLTQSLTFVWQFVPPIVLLVIWCAIRFRQKMLASNLEHNQTVDTSTLKPASFRCRADTAVLASLFLMPVSLVVFSYIVQPATINRYAIPATLAFVPVYATLVGRNRPVGSFVLLAIASVVFCWSVDRAGQTWDHNLKRITTLETELLQTSSDHPVLFEDRIDYWLLQHKHQRPNWYQLPFDPLTADDTATSIRPALRIVQRDVAAAVAQHYPQTFVMKEWNDLPVCDHVFVIPYANQKPLPPPNRFRLTEENEGLWRATSIPGSEQ